MLQPFLRKQTNPHARPIPTSSHHATRPVFVCTKDQLPMSPAVTYRLLSPYIDGPSNRYAYHLPILPETAGGVTLTLNGPQTPTSALFLVYLFRLPDALWCWRTRQLRSNWFPFRYHI
ncbi:MAG: hypothetical protein NZ602_06555 [Thermoguttaceae bacterium]|nr:hypothetical protein [Thermoguttaceae bacterium]MDW8036942.1 hypothetical protein [Thermoguttaceae bacterium]